MTHKPLIVFGSARSNGNTFQAVQQVMEKIQGATFLDLADHQIHDFNYDLMNLTDDFVSILEKMQQHQTILFATPVYWYTMSTPMKRFVDRITDILASEHPFQELLSHKNLGVIASYGSYPEGIDGFEPIFQNIARYLKMNYVGSYLCYTGENKSSLHENQLALTRFINQLSAV